MMKGCLVLCACLGCVWAAGDALTFNASKFQIKKFTAGGKEHSVRAYERIPYAAKPVDTALQVMNIYVPAEYSEGKTVGGYTAETAPIFFLNKIGGYMPAEPASLAAEKRGDTGFRDSTVQAALAHGYVVASPGTRGRSGKNADGSFTGKAPAAIVDLKAAVRYLKWNDSRMPGNAKFIISDGTSAGGALSALLGATGNNKDYAPYLESIGAAPAADDIFAVSAYCPITNLEHADMAYEWQFKGVNERHGMNLAVVGGKMTRTPVNDTLSPAQIRVSEKLARAFPAYVNSLKLRDGKGSPLTLDSLGKGPFLNYVKSFVIASAKGAQAGGADLNKFPWLEVSGGKITGVNFPAYVRAMQRQKTPPAFDALDISSDENQEFGTSKTDALHFTDFSLRESTVKAGIADAKIIRMMNPLYYIGAAGTKCAAHWRIRHGTKDKDTGLAVSVILATELREKGADVNFALPWERPHSGDYDLDELFAWIDAAVAADAAE